MIGLPAGVGAVRVSRWRNKKTFESEVTALDFRKDSLKFCAGYMNRPVKIILYVVFITAAVWFGLKAKEQYHKATASELGLRQKLDEASSADAANAVTDSTNAVAGATNVAGQSTNAVGRTRSAAPASASTAGATISYSRMISFGLLCAAGLVGFAFLFARDVSHVVAHKAERALFADDGAPVDPEYEHAEELWKDGKYLESIQAMREYLHKHPREQYVSLRIAEIYEENLFNPLAAALEYEEVLKKNLPAERWGWAAIHLANIYSGKLNQPTKAIDLLHRIDSEYGRTVAANKARERLAQVDPNFVPAAAAAVAPVTADEAEPKPASNLPPGFRPKQ